MRAVLDVVTVVAFLEFVAVMVVTALVLHWHFWSIRFAERFLRAYERRHTDGGEWPVEKKL